MENKKSYCISVFVLLIILFIVGCDEITPIGKDTYKLKDIYADPKDIKLVYNNQRISNICFDVVNNAQTTLSPRVEILADDNCFEESRINEIGSIAPSAELHYCVELSVPYNSYRDEDYQEQCSGKKHQINISLQDVSGTELKEGKISVGIIR